MSKYLSIFSIFILTFAVLSWFFPKPVSADNSCTIALSPSTNVPVGSPQTINYVITYPTGTAINSFTAYFYDQNGATSQIMQNATTDTGSVTVDSNNQADYSGTNFAGTTISGTFTANSPDTTPVGIFSTDGQYYACAQKMSFVSPIYSISGNVYNDVNHNGVKDSGESNFTGATVTLSGASSASATSDSNGNYTFSGLVGGSYTVTLTDPTGYGSTTTNPVNLSLNANTTENFGITTTTDLKITPVADDFVSANNQTANYGTLDYLRIDSSPVKTSFLKYDLSSLAGKTITAVKFKVATYSDSNANTAGSVYVYLVNNTSWGETTLNYNNQPAVSTTLLGTLTNLTSNNTKYNFQLDPTGIQPKTGGLLSIGITSNNGSQLHLYSREATNVDYTPKLVISYY